MLNEDFHYNADKDYSAYYLNREVDLSTGVCTNDESGYGDYERSYRYN